MADAGRIRQAADRVLAGAGLHLEGEEGEPLLVVDDTGDPGSWPIAVVVDEDEEVLVVYANPPEPVPVDRLAAVSEFCHRANLGLSAGCFELDLDDAEVRIRCGGRLGPGIDPDGLMSQAMETVSDLASAYGEALGEVVGGAEPAAAVASAEA